MIGKTCEAMAESGSLLGITLHETERRSGGQRATQAAGRQSATTVLLGHRRSEMITSTIDKRHGAKRACETFDRAVGFHRHQRHLVHREVKWSCRRVREEEVLRWRIIAIKGIGVVESGIGETGVAAGRGEERVMRERAWEWRRRGSDGVLDMFNRSSLRSLWYFTWS